MIAVNKRPTNCEFIGRFARTRGWAVLDGLRSRVNISRHSVESVVLNVETIRGGGLQSFEHFAHATTLTLQTLFWAH